MQFVTLTIRRKTYLNLLFSGLVTTVRQVIASGADEAVLAAQDVLSGKTENSSINISSSHILLGFILWIETEIERMSMLPLVCSRLSTCILLGVDAKVSSGVLKEYRSFITVPFNLSSSSSFFVVWLATIGLYSHKRRFQGYQGRPGNKQVFTAVNVSRMDVASSFLLSSI